MPRLRAWAPGRVNLVGDHTDYTGGLALPMAIGLGVEIRGERAGDRVVLRSTAVEGLADLPLRVDAPADAEPPWARYVAGVLAELGPPQGLSGTITSTLPSGQGLASSAALEVVVAVALGADLDDPLALALACQRAEHRAVGVPCGIMDQLTVAAAVDGAALRLDCRSLEVSPVVLPDGIDVVVVDSGQRRELTTSPYARRRDELARAAALIGPLRDAEPADVASVGDPVLRRRARHVTTENLRVDALVAAFEAGDLGEAAEVMAASHRSLRDDLQISTPQIDRIVDHLQARPGVHGARLTGGGFGGCVVALCDSGTDAMVDIPVVWRGRPAAGARALLLT
jgi:galactokinase